MGAGSGPEQDGAAAGLTLGPVPGSGCAAMGGWELKSLIIVHPSWFIRTVLAVSRPFIR